jgi:hypothetical protein
MRSKVQKEINESNKVLGKLTDKQLEQYVSEGHKEIASKAGKISATKQWKENRDGELEKSSMGGKKAVESNVGVHALSKKQKAKNGKKGYQNGLGKLSIKQKIKIASNAGLVNREKNATLKVKDVIFMRKYFIPRHPQFGVVAFSKKYGVAEGTIRSAIKRKSFKDIK